ncbi:unnamed protein product [Rotaria magnacalcarata]|uniref:RNA-dependent RNA polymerase n=1 Tax=Rotaria magnacalcarata TaxID=392030 RepID=A0A816TXX1_9BILA|nr:unnamed protein product [Rotaria magnacalcarata]
MSTAESELDDNPFDDINDDDNDYDDDYDFDDTNHFTKLINVILRQARLDGFEIPSVDIPTNYAVRTAMTSNLHDLTMLNTSAAFVNDSLRMYLTAPPLVRKKPNTEKYCFASDLTPDESEKKVSTNSAIYVGNLPPNIVWQDLKNWFIEQGYPVNHVDMKTNKVGVDLRFNLLLIQIAVNYFQKGAPYAFVRFDSFQTALEVVYASTVKSKTFVFKGQQLHINHSHNKPLQQPKNTPITRTTTTTSDNISKSLNLTITDIHYGTLITGAAMRNIQTENSTVSNDSKCGIIAHRLLTDKCINMNLNIDTDKKKIAIIGNFQLDHTDYSDSATTLKFEWNFLDLKSRKISPVLINQDEVFLLLELKRPPIILQAHTTSNMFGDESDEKRLPGWGLVGYANAWLFKLLLSNQHDEYLKLFETLRRYNLSPRQFSEDNIMHLIERTENARKNLESIPLISNDEWVKENQTKVDDFFNRRWPSYPFETKFEIMKLISKRIITVNDLIVDEQAENLLKLCSINTLIALTDKIVEIAPRWFTTICDHEYEDWHHENEQDEPHVEFEGNQMRINKELSFDDRFISKHIRSCVTGSVVNDTDTDIASLKTPIENFSLAPSKCHIGIFSRFLISAFEELLKKFDLCRTATTKIYVTKLELRTASVDPFLMRKIYITPSTIFYEGPYREEKCAVTRQYVNHQDRFLRVTFRDEDYRVLHNYNDNMTKIYERIKKILINGVNVCDRHYEFLAFSSSQLREHSCWMFARADDGTTVDSIRAWMGDFRNVRPVAKLAARLGQSFSTSVKGIQLESIQRREISDVEKEEILGEHSRKHCFTDGIGIISRTFAKRLAQQMKLTQKVCPCAFQIRCGGYKGMVCLDIANRITDPNVNVYFRGSMKKFDANSFSIDVVRTSLNPSVAYLNRQIILLLSSLGIPNDIFISLQDEMLQQLKALTGNSYEAQEAIKELNEFGGNGYLAFLIAYLKSLGEKKDPFARQLLFAFQAFLVKEL